MISFSIVFFFLSLFSYYLCSLPAVSKSFIYISIYIYIYFFFPTLSRVLLVQSLSQFRCSSPPFPLHFPGTCSLCQFISSHFSTWPAHVLLINFFLELSLTSTSTLISSISRISSHNSHKYSYHVSFPQTWTFSCCFYVSAIIASAFKCARVTHELSTFLLHLHDMRLSPITPSTFL